MADYRPVCPTVALRKESVDRNTQRRDFKALGLPSLSARRAWIEMADMSNAWHRFTVALRKESVDRNTIAYVTKKRKKAVALRKESVDRNILCSVGFCLDAKSLSARRAWIEIRLWACSGGSACVALRKESVDRNVLYH